MKGYENGMDALHMLWPGTPKIVPGSFRPLEIPGRGRDDIPALLATMGAQVGVEVGVERGKYSRVLLQAESLKKLTLVDAWAKYPGYRDHVSQDKLEGFYDEVRELEQSDKRVWLLRAFSVNAAEHFPDGGLDFVYIDANHRIQDVIADLAAWTPKVRSGGLIMGHDYRKPKNNIGHHVVEAVNAWTYAYRICPWYLLGTKGDPNRDQNRSWMWVKP